LLRIGLGRFEIARHRQEYFLRVVAQRQSRHCFGRGLQA
jgi:hypothetical protein